MKAAVLPRSPSPDPRPDHVSLVDDVISERHFDQLSANIESMTGIRLPHAKKAMLEGRLRPLARRRGAASLAEYADFLFSRGGLTTDFSQIINSVTTNKTDFFRESDHFELLKSKLVPEILSRRSAQRPLKFWSAAGSTGAEAYTIAMVLADMQLRTPFDATILSTDISTDVNDKARRAIYPLEMIAPIPLDFRKRYTMAATNEDRKEFRIVPELRRLVEVKQLNLTASNYGMGSDFDVIFCRNVLIYFEKKMQHAVVTRLAGHLRPGGFLLLGHSEAMNGNETRSLTPVAPTVFQRRAGVT